MHHPTPDRPLRESDLDPDPIAQFRAWMREAEAAQIHLADAMALATAGADGEPTVRHVLLRGLDPGGFVFFTNYGSRKARQLEENPRAALVFLWRELERQVCATGTVERVTPEESDAYFRSRPREAQIGAWASRQSEVIGSRQELESAYVELDRAYSDGEVPRPSFWGGFRLAPDTVEFWQGRLHRLHDRFRYTWDAGAWRIERLSP
jgi:pyridoxamine 5'-phosphate oxidase